MPKSRYTDELIHESTAGSPLGRVTLGGFGANSPGIGRERLRVLGSYALVYLLRGGGIYGDSNGLSRSVSVGDLIVIFPELGHRYGPRSGNAWDEFYLVFDGPVFDRLRAGDLLDVRRPVVHLGEPRVWLPRLLEVVEPGLSNLPAHALHRVTRLASLLGSAMLDNTPEREDPWLSRAMQLLREPGEKNLTEVADQLGLTYTAFRKRFTRLAGVPPARWRAVIVIDRAKTLIRNPQNTLAKIARELGLADEFHLSRRFKQMTGIAPKEYRRFLSRGV